MGKDLLEAFDAEGKVVDRASLESVPARVTPGDPVPIFTMTVNAGRIAYIEFPVRERANTSRPMKCASFRSKA